MLLTKEDNIITHILPNGKYIYYNNNTYQSDLQRLLTTTDYSAIEDSIQDNYNTINNKIDNSIIYGYKTTSGDEVSFNIGVSSFKALIISAYAYVRNNHTYHSGYVFVLNNNST